MQVPGVRLNIGLAYYRQNEFLKAIPPFESVVKQEPAALQPRYLLGLCYFFTERWADAADTLQCATPCHSEVVHVSHFTQVFCTRRLRASGNLAPTSISASNNDGLRECALALAVARGT